MSAPRATPHWIGPARCAAVRLEPPPLPPSKRRRILPALLGRHIPFPLEDCAIAFEPQPDGSVMGFAARREVIAALGPAVRPVPAAWALWHQALREHPPTSPDEKRAVLCPDVDGSPCVALGHGATLHSAASLPVGSEDLSSLGLGTDTRILRIASPDDFRARALASCRTTLRIPGDTSSGSRHLPFLAAALLALLTAALLIVSERALRSARAAADDLDEAFTTRVSLLAGYPVTARGDRALRIALDAASTPPSPILQHLLRPGPSRTLAATLETAAAHNIHLFHATIDDTGPALSGDAPDHASLDAFAADSAARGLPLRVEPDPGTAPGERLRFMATPLSSAP